MTTKPLIIHHAGCMDGFTAAWAARCGWITTAEGDESLHDAELVAAHYGDEPPNVEGRHVAIVDFSYPRGVLLEMHRKAMSLLVLDHHKGARAELDGLPFCVFDMTRSGAGLAWDELVAKHTGEPRPWLVDYVEDRDVWRWALPHSREVSAYLRTLEFSLETWDDLVLRRCPEDLVTPGAAIVRMEERLIRKHVARARVQPFAGFEVPIVNATTCISEIGNELASEHPFAVIWQEVDGGFAYSLRSSPSNPEHVDVSVVAKRLGGGGHRHSAGARVPRLVHPWVTRST